MRASCVGFVLFAALVGAACGQEKKTATITITVPEAGYKETVVTVDGVELKGTGATRVFTSPALDAGKDMALTSLADAAASHRVMFAADKSAATGKTVKL